MKNFKNNGQKFAFLISKGDLLKHYSNSSKTTIFQCLESPKLEGKKVTIAAKCLFSTGAKFKPKIRYPIRANPKTIFNIMKPL